MQKLLSAGLLCLMFFVVSCGSDAPSGDNHRTTDNLRGKVKTVTEQGYQAEMLNGEWAKGIFNRAYNKKSYNAEGFKTSDGRIFVGSNAIDYSYEYIYDEEGKVQRVNQLGFNGTVGAFLRVDELQGKVRIVKHTAFFNTSPEPQQTGYRESVWDGYKLVETREYLNDGTLLNTFTYKYNDHGDVILETRVFENDNGRNLSIKSTYTKFDEQGNWTEVLREYEGFPLTEFYEREYEYYEE